jgi:hypothetical protein
MASALDRRMLTGVLGRALLVPAAATAVHQLRFVLAFGGESGIVLARQGHAYLHSLAPWIVLLIAIAVGGFLWALGQSLRGQRSISHFTLSFVGLWIACSASLVAIYAAQEFLEGLFAAGHPAGLVGIFGYGGWWAIPAAACLGLVLAAVFHGARWVLEQVARRARTTSSRVIELPLKPRPRDFALARVVPLAAGWSSRGPPR